MKKAAWDGIGGSARLDWVIQQVTRSLLSTVIGKHGDDGAAPGGHRLGGCQRRAYCCSCVAVRSPEVE